MPKVSDRKSHRGRMFLMKGESGTAKTTAEASFPGETYIFDIDNRIGWLNECPWIDASRLDYDIYTDWDKVSHKLEQIENHCNYQNIIISSLTSLSRATINTLIRNRGTPNPRSKEKEQLNVGGIPIMGIAEYNGESSGLNIILTQLRVIHNIWKCNVFLECHVVSGEVPQLDGSTKVFRRIVTGGNKVAAEIPVYFDEKYHFYCVGAVEGNARNFTCHTRSNTVDFASTTIPDLPDIINHTNESFYNIWSSYLPKEREVQTISNSEVGDISSVFPDINS